MDQRHRSALLNPDQYASLIAQMNAQKAEMDAARAAEAQAIGQGTGRTMAGNNDIFNHQIQPLTPQAYLNNPQDYPFVARQAAMAPAGRMLPIPLAAPPEMAAPPVNIQMPTQAMPNVNQQPMQTSPIDTILRGLAGYPGGDSMSRHHAQPRPQPNPVPQAPTPPPGPGMAQMAINAGGSGDIPALEAGPLIPQMASNYINGPMRMHPPVPNQALIPIPPTINPPQLQGDVPTVQPTSFEAQAPVPGVSQNPIYGMPAGPMPPMPRPPGPQAQPINTRIPPLMRVRTTIGRPIQGSQQPSRAVAPQAPQAASLADEIQGRAAIGKFNSGFDSYGADNIPPLPQSAPPPQPPATTPPSPPKGPVEMGTAIPGDTKDQIIAMALRAAFNQKAMKNAN